MGYSTTYDRATGRLLCHMSCPDGREALQASDAIGVLIGHYDVETMRVDGDAVVRRPQLPEPSKWAIEADGVDAAVFSDLPVPCDVTIDDASYTVDDGEFVFRSDDPGAYTFSIKSWPYMDFTGTLTVELS